MHFVLQQNHLLYFLCFLITQTISAPIKDFLPTEQYNGLEANDTVNQELSVYERFPTSSTSTGIIKRRSSDFYLKIIAILMACIILGFGITRLCLILCNSSRSSNNVSSNRHTSVVRPEIATIRQNNFKPDLPPAYAEAVATIDNDESKLPSYDELRNANTSSM